MQTTKTLPNDVEMEKSLLASILVDSDVMDDVDLKPDEFYWPAHRKIFHAMQVLINNSEPVELVSVMSSLNEKKELEAVGGAAYLSKLIDFFPVSGNPPFYADKIRKKSRLRKLIQKSNAIINACFDESMSASEILEQSQISIMEIGSSEKNPTHVGEILPSNISKLEELGKGNTSSGILTGHKLIDVYTSGFQKSNLIILAARPAMGKTALALNWVRNFCQNNSPGIFFSIEMAKEELVNRLISDVASINGSKFRNGRFNDGEWPRIIDSSSFISELPLYIIDEESISIARIASLARKYQKLHQIEWIVIDYIQLIEGWTKDGQGPKAEITRSLKKLSRTLKVPVIALSQLNRELEKRHDKRPVKADLRDTGAIEQDADIIIFIYRDEVYNNAKTNPNRGIAEIIIDKNRGGETGPVKLSFISQLTRFKDYSERYSNNQYSV